MRFQSAIFAFALMSLLLPLGHPAQACNATYQCNEGYCVNSTCTVPSYSAADYYGACNKTVDCEFGFCYQSKCTSPKPVSSLINIEPKNGCTGFVELLPGGYGAYVCDFMWIVLVGATTLAVFFARSFGIPVILASVIIPLALGIFVAPIGGVAAAVLEIVVFIARRRTQVVAQAKKAQAETERTREMEILDSEEQKEPAQDTSFEIPPSQPKSVQPREQPKEKPEGDLPPNWVEPEPIEPAKKT